MAQRKTLLQPRIKDDIAQVLEFSAQKNSRKVAQELDVILRSHFFTPMFTCGGLGPSEEIKKLGGKTLAQEMGFHATKKKAKK